MEEVRKRRGRGEAEERKKLERGDEKERNMRRIGEEEERKKRGRWRGRGEEAEDERKSIWT